MILKGLKIYMVDVVNMRANLGFAKKVLALAVFLNLAVHRVYKLYV